MPDMENKRKISLGFWITVATSYCCALGAGKVEPFICLNVFAQEIWIIFHLKPMFFSYDLHDILTDMMQSWLQMLKLNSCAFLQRVNISTV